MLQMLIIYLNIFGNMWFHQNQSNLAWTRASQSSALVNGKIEHFASEAFPIMTLASDDVICIVKMGKGGFVSHIAKYSPSRVRVEYNPRRDIQAISTNELAHMNTM